MIYLYIRREGFGFDFKLKSFAIDGRTFKSLSNLGLPLTVQTTAINVSMLYVTAGVNSYGLVYSSVFGIGSKLHNIMFIITNSVNTASATMFGQNLGAGQVGPGEAGLLVRQSLLYGLLPLRCRGLSAVPGVHLPDVHPGCGGPVPGRPLYGLPGGDVPGLRHHDRRCGPGQRHRQRSLSLITALLDGVVVRIGLCMLMSGPLGMGVWGYFWGNALAGFVSTIIGDFYYLTGLWKKRRLMVEQ